MEQKKLLEMQKKASGAIGKGVTGFIGAVILIFLVVSLLPEVFTQLDAMVTGAVVPGWIITLTGVMVGVGFVYIIWKAIESR